jgi:hypothetical protein
MKTTLRLYCRLAIFFVAATPFASANFLFSTNGGTSVGLRGLDNQVTRDINGTFSLYGTNITSINVADDGFIGTGDVAGIFLDRSLGALAANTANHEHPDPVIAAYYDLLTFGQGSTITDQSVSGVYYAVNYQSVYAFSDTAVGHSTDAQIVLFMSNTSVGGFKFLAGDIAISYGNINTKIEADTFTVGVAFDRNTFTGTPGSSDGQLTNFDSLPRGSEFVLYRPDGATYAVSIQDTATQNTSGVPEPASLVLGGLGLVGVAILRRRKRST